MNVNIMRPFPKNVKIVDLNPQNSHASSSKKSFKPDCEITASEKKPYTGMNIQTLSLGVKTA